MKKNTYKKKITKKRSTNKKKNHLKKALLTICIVLLGSLSMYAFTGMDSISQSGIETVILDEWLATLDDAIQFIQGVVKQAISTFRAMENYLGEGNYEIVQLEDIPEYSSTPYVVLNNNRPLFTKEEITDNSYEEYAELDLLGRCGVTMACIGRDIMPTEERGAIGMVKPSGWKLKKYDIVDGKYLYNRCHLIGYQLTGENANEKNLITGTRYMNVEGMLPFENEVAKYVEDTGNHVMYRVTPVFEGNNLVASGVQMEAWSVEDNGAGVCFHVFVYNVQPGISIDYATGESWLTE